jgi:hypothetical protein
MCGCFGYASATAQGWSVRGCEVCEEACEQCAAECTKCRDEPCCNACAAACNKCHDACKVMRH